MAGGLGTKLFLQGDTLSADDVNGYFMNQAVMRFATTAARDAAFGNGIAVSLGGDGKPLLQEGMVAYIDSLDLIQYYNGSSWQDSEQFTVPNLSITTEKLAAGSVTADKIADGTVIAADIANGAVTTDKLANSAVTSDKIGANAVTMGTQTTGNYVSIVTAGSGISVTGSGSETASVSVAIDSSVVTLSDSQTLTNKSINLASNTITGTVALFNTALSDGDFATLAGSETLTNKTLTNPTITGVSPVITLAGDLSGSVTLTNLGSATLTAAVAANAVALGTDTTGNYVATVSGTANQVTISGSGTESAAITVSLPQDIATTSNPTFAGATLDAIQVGVTAAGEIDTTSGNLTIDSAGGTVTVDDNLVVSGDLTVSGTTTTVNTATLNVSDNIVVLNNDVTGSPTEDAGIEVERGTSSNVSILWDETADVWELTNDGTNYRQIATTSGTETLTNKTLTAPILTTPDIRITVNSQSASAYTIVSGDAGKYIEMTSASSNTVTIPSGIGADGSQIVIVQYGAGKTQVVGGAGVTVRATPGAYLRAQYSSATLLRRSSTEWFLFGDLSAT